MPTPLNESVTNSIFIIYCSPFKLQCVFIQLPYSVAVAVNIRVGNELGAGNIISAKRASYIGFGVQSKQFQRALILVKTSWDCLISLCAVFNGVVITGLALIFRNQLGRIFTSDE